MRRRNHLRPRNPGPARPHEGAWARTDGGGGPYGVDAGQRGYMETIHDRYYIDARETLLDAIEALRRHSDAVVLVGAQAVYVHTESEDESFAVSPFHVWTQDIVLDPRLLGAALR